MHSSPRMHKPNATIIIIILLLLFSYSLEDRGTDRQTESISECTLKNISNEIWHAYQSWKLVDDEENNTPPPLH